MARITREKFSASSHENAAREHVNQYFRLRTPGTFPTLSDTLALANYHATMAVLQAIEELTSRLEESNGA